MKEQIIESVREILRRHKVDIAVSGDQIVIDPDGSVDLTFQQLNELARYFRTEKIDLEYSKSTGPWSEFTPGDSSEFYIRIYESPLRKDLES